MSSIRNVVITGANRGIGLALVEAVLAASEDLKVFLGTRSPERGEQARRGLLSQHPHWESRLEVLPLDVCSDESVQAAAEQLRRAAAGGLYGLINNAGVASSPDGMRGVLEVNLYGLRRTSEALIPLLPEEGGRVVQISSASGPNFVSRCHPEQQRRLTDPAIRWEELDALLQSCLQLEARGGSFAEAGFGDGQAYGLSKAAVNAYTLSLARRFPQHLIHACTPGFIETDMTRPWAESRGVTPESMGMKPPAAGTRSALHLLLGELQSSGWYWGSDAERSPLDRYRSPGDPPYRG